MFPQLTLQKINSATCFACTTKLVNEYLTIRYLRGRNGHKTHNHIFIEITACSWISFTCGHRWASTSTSMSAISDINICYSDIGDKYVGQKNVIPISEVFRYRHQSSFRYPTLKKKIFHSADTNPRPWNW